MEVDFIKYAPPQKWSGADPWKADDIAVILEAINERIELVGGYKEFAFPYQATRYDVILWIRSFILNNIGQFYDLDFDTNRFEEYNKKTVSFPKMLSLSDFDDETVRAIYELPSRGSPASEFIPFLKAIPKVLKKMRAVFFSGKVMSMKYYARGFRRDIGYESDSIQDFLNWSNYSEGFTGPYTYQYPSVILADPVTVENIELDEKDLSLKKQLKSMDQYWQLYDEKNTIFELPGGYEIDTLLVDRLQSARAKINRYFQKTTFASEDVNFIRQALDYASKKQDVPALQAAINELQLCMMYDDSPDISNEEKNLLQSLDDCIERRFKEANDPEYYWYGELGVDYLMSKEYWGMQNPLKFTSFLEIGRGIAECDIHVNMDTGRPSHCPSYLNIKRDALQILGTSRPHTSLKCDMLFRYSIHPPDHPSKPYILYQERGRFPPYLAYYYDLYATRSPSNVPQQYKEGFHKIADRIPWTDKLNLNQWFGSVHWQPLLSDIQSDFAPPVEANHYAAMLGFEGEIKIICDFGVPGGLKFI